MDIKLYSHKAPFGGDVSRATLVQRKGETWVVFKLEGCESPFFVPPSDEEGSKYNIVRAALLQKGDLVSGYYKVLGNKDGSNLRSLGQDEVLELNVELKD
jgi:hypothetical protein